MSDAMHAQRSPVRVSIESRHDQIEPVQAEVDDALARAGLDEDCRYRIGVAVGEAVANAITHGNRRDPDKRVELELTISDGEAVVRVVDQGDGFDVRWVGDPTSPENLLEPSGRGIFLMRSFMGEVVYESGAAGTEVQLRKRFADPAITRGGDPSRQNVPPHSPDRRPAEGAPMTIETRYLRGVAILEPRGRLTIGGGEVALRTAVHETLETGARNLVLDGGSMTGMDSSGLGELVTSYTTVAERGGTLKLARLPRKAVDLMKVTQLISVFEVYDTVDEALASFD